MANKDFFFTLVRNLPGDSNEKPNGFLFGSLEKPSDDTLRAIYHDEQLRAMLSPKKPAFVLRYYKLPVTTPGFLPEWRTVLTTLSYYALPLNDERDNVTMLWTDRIARAGEVERILHYKDLLANCTELYRAVGCDGCPKKGLQCVEQNFGERPWFMRFSYNRKDDWSTGLADEGTIIDRKKTNEEHDFAVKNLDEALKRCAKLSPAGATWRSPMDTKPLATPKMNHPLRPPRDHRFFKDPDAPPPAAENK